MQITAKKPMIEPSLYRAVFRRQPVWYNSFMKLTYFWQTKLPDHPTVSALSLERTRLGARLTVTIRGGRTRSKLLLFFYPKDPSDFHCASGGFFMDVGPRRGQTCVRLYWHDFENGQSLKIAAFCRP